MNRNSFRWFAPIIFVLIIGCFYVSVYQALPIAEFFFGSKSLGDKDALDITSSFGDTSGFINALFSALAFGGVLLTFYWQFMVEGKQHKATLQSQFENVFFNMTNTLNEIVAGLSVLPAYLADNPNSYGHYYSNVDKEEKDKAASNPIRGREVFAFWFDCFVEKANGQGNLIIIFEEMMEGSLDHYFRYLYRILVYIDQSELIDEDKKYEYAAILRAQLSDYELLILFFNGFKYRFSNVL